jgi:hypothetical protein
MPPPGPIIMSDQSEAIILFHGVLWKPVSEHVNPFSHSLKMWVVVLHPKYTGQSHFPLCLWTCSKNPMSVSVFFSDKFCHIFDWNVENSNKFSNFCGKISPNFEYQRIETNNPGQRVILLVKKSLMSSEVNTTVEYGYCEEHLSLSLSLSHTQKLLQTKWWITLQWHFFEDWVVSKVSPSSTLSLLVAQEISISVLHHQLFHFSCWSDLCCTSIIHSFNFFCVCGRDLCCTVIIKLFGFRRWTSHANESRQLTTQQGHDDENRFHSYVFFCVTTQKRWYGLFKWSTMIKKSSSISFHVYHQYIYICTMEWVSACLLCFLIYPWQS